MTANRSEATLRTQFATALRARMTERGVSVNRLAKSVGAQHHQVNGWLHRRYLPSYASLRRLCMELGLSADALMGLEGRR